MKRCSNVNAKHFDDDKYLLIVSQYDGWNVYLNRIDHCFYLYNYKSMVKFQLPQIKKKLHGFSKCIVLCDSDHPNPTVMLIYNHFKTRINYTCQLGQKWRKGTLLYAEGDAEVIYYVTFWDVVLFNGKFYGFNRQCDVIEILIGLEDRRNTGLDFRFNVTVMLPSTWFETARFVVSCNELFLVIILTNIKFVLFRLDVLNKKFIPIYNLGDQVFFVKGNYATSYLGEQVGHAGNCLCSADEGNELLYVMNFQDATLSVKKVHDFNNYGSGSGSGSGIGSGSARKRRRKGKSSSRTTNREDGKDDSEEESLIMLNIPLHLQEHLAKYVSKGRDYLNFRSVCTTWRRMIPTRQWKSSVSTINENECPWLISNKRDVPTCKLFDPRDNATYLMSDPELSDCVIRCSKDGWLLVSKGCTVFLYEPFAKKKIELPDLDSNYCYNGICLSDNPSSSELSIFGFYHLYPIWMVVVYLNPGDHRWTSRHCRHPVLPFTPSYCNPVFSNGAFYCLSQEGNLGVFKLQELTWDIVTISTPSLVSLSPTTKMVPNFIIPYHQDLYSVYVSNVAGEFVKVYKLVEILSGEWEEVTSLGNMTLFVSETSCFALVAPKESMRNMIYFPCFSLINNKHVFYCLESGTYRTFGGDGGDISTKRLYDTKEQLQCTWIQPRLVPSSW